MANDIDKKKQTVRSERLRPVPIKKRANQLIPVVVGGPQVTFVPNMVLAAVGDVVQFQFSNGNHTVTQSAEGQACTPLQMTDPNAVHSGHIPFKDGQQMVGTFNMVVTKTDPMFLYCATGPHCQLGQIMVINPYVFPSLSLSCGSTALMPLFPFHKHQKTYTKGSLRPTKQIKHPAAGQLQQDLGPGDQERRRPQGQRRQRRTDPSQPRGIRPGATRGRRQGQGRCRQRKGWQGDRRQGQGRRGSSSSGGGSPCSNPGRSSRSHSPSCCTGCSPGRGGTCCSSGRGRR